MINPIQQNVVFKGGIKANNAEFTGNKSVATLGVRDTYRDTLDSVSDIQKAQMTEAGKNLDTIA